jgi:hypothetical protein
VVDQLDVLAMQNWNHLQVKWTHHPLVTSISDILDSSSFRTSTFYQKYLTTPTSHASSPGTWMDSACFYHELGKVYRNRNFVQRIPSPTIYTPFIVRNAGNSLVVQQRVEECCGKDLDAGGMVTSTGT